MHDSKSLFQKLEGTLAEKLCVKELLKEQVIIYVQKSKEFIQKEIVISFNTLIIENQFIELSKCQFEQKLSKPKYSEGINIIIIKSTAGKEFLITSNSQQCLRLKIYLKKFCVHKNYSGRYRFIEQQNCLPLSQSYKKNNQYFSTIKFEKKLLEDPQELQTFHNQLTIMHAFQLMPNVFRLCEDASRYYILGENMKLQSLESLLLNGFDFKEVPFVSIIYMVLQTIQKYQAKGIYHGNISLSNIYVNIDSQTLQITLLFPKYKENNNKNIEKDICSLGKLIYQITFHTLKGEIVKDVNLNLIQSLMNQWSEPNSQRTKYRFLYRVSQLDLLNQLLSSKMTVEMALIHQWFVNIRQNLKVESKQSMPKAFLSTIMEEQELHIASSQFLDNQVTITQEYEPEEELYPIRCQLVNTIQMIPSKKKHDDARNYFYRSKTFASFTIKRESLPEITKQWTFK
ncbi:unnamed protein product (macronuclear) [Paramecium tetraurelia]|uniref:Protein kinase domain-containing protein n=1 Tax=Paramecium tetraurelia TaxID=5888 RepID=A0E9G3_PARTE|nr:uncharacterized protein GSPATT00024661001 [Paramecium tetraurelia]CAK91930.1 unnamed protein product [Paramecium tetraurelia]|eukprot:XP_001459327.1 hypothetical protein (macronuclear) [Paramecium tetraurelia strain d4-2]